MSAALDPTPPVKGDTSLRFPLATFGQVRHEVAAQLRRVRHSTPALLAALVLLSLGAWAAVTVPQVMGQIVDLVTGASSRPFWQLGAVLFGAAVAGVVLARRGADR